MLPRYAASVPGNTREILVYRRSDAANTKYYINLNVGGGNVSGFIVTDGTIGSLGLVNFLDWNLLLNDGQKTFTLLGPLSGSNSGAEVGTTAMTATATQLLFNFSGPAGADFFQYPAPGSGQSDLCFATEGLLCGGLTSAGEKVFITGDAPQLNQPLSGTLVIATTTPLAVPALSPVVLAALGFLLTGMSLWRIRGTYRARHSV
jgi:hypothetical protein